MKISISVLSTSAAFFVSQFASAAVFTAVCKQDVEAPHSLSQKSDAVYEVEVSDDLSQATGRLVSGSGHFLLGNSFNIPRVKYEANDLPFVFSNVTHRGEVNGGSGTIFERNTQGELHLTSVSNGFAYFIVSYPCSEGQN